MIDKGLSINQPVRSRVKLFDYKATSENYPTRTLPITNPSHYKNLFYENGALTVGYGITDIMSAKALPYPINDTANIAMTYYKGKDGSKNMLVAYHTMHGVFIMDMGMYANQANVSWQKISAFPYRQAEEFRINGENILIFSAGKDLAKYDGETFTYLANAAPISALTACNHYGRLFLGGLLNPYKLHFSDEIDPFNFTISAFDGGYINLDIDFGGLIKLVSMNEYLYLIMQRGIMRLRAYGDQSEFQLKKMDVYTGDIIADTIQKCGDKIVFMSSAGLMAFDGYSCNVIHAELKDKLAKDLKVKATDIHACYCYNTYFLAYWCSNNITEILAIDFSKNGYSFVDSNLIVGMVRIDRDGEQLVLFNTITANLAEIPPLKWLESGGAASGIIKGSNIDFNEPNKVKVIKGMDIPEGMRGKITLSNRVNPPKTISLTNNKYVDINLAGKVFDITLEIMGKQANFSPIVSIDMQRSS